jgi:hypothetical protein
VKPRTSRLPGFRWRVLAHHQRRSADPVALEYEGHEGVCFDELVLWGGKDRKTGDDRFVMHLEQMNDRAWWMSVGDAYVWIYIPPSGPVEVSIRRGEYGPVCGTTEVPEAAVTREER